MLCSQIHEIVHLQIVPVDHILTMNSYPRSQEDEAKTKNVWLKGHVGRYQIRSILILFPNISSSDHGTITVLYSQPVAALQILGRDGKWLWVKHVENALVCIRFLPVHWNLNTFLCFR